MLTFTQGNLLNAEVEAVVNTVNTVGVMGKGIALMFKERYKSNNLAYIAACKADEVQTGKMFVTSTNELAGPSWIINFPTKKHWRSPSKIEWVKSGLDDLIRVVRELNIRSIAIPPLGCGNGGLAWQEVKSLIENAAAQIPEVEILAFAPTDQYQNVAKRTGVQKLTIPRALMAESIRRYWMLGIECTVLEIQKLAWLLERTIAEQQKADVLKLEFHADRYGPYSSRLNHLLNSLDGSYLRSDKRISDCTPTDTIAFNDSKAEAVTAFLGTGEAKAFSEVIDATDKLIDGFQSPLGMELLSTVDWLIRRENCTPEIGSLKDGLSKWPAGASAGQRKLKLFDERLLSLAIERLNTFPAAKH